MQLGGADASGFRDLIDLRLLAPMATDVSDGAAHHAVVGGRGAERSKVGYPVGRKHGGLHRWLSI